MRPGPINSLLVSLSLVSGSLQAGPMAERSAVSVEEGLVSVHVTDMPLADLFSAMNGTGGVTINAYGDTAGMRTSGAIDRAPPGQALRRLLADHSYVLIEYGVDGSLFEVILLGPAGAGSESPVADAAPPTASDATSEPRSNDQLVFAAQSAPSAEERAAALDLLAYSSPEHGPEPGYAAPLLLQAITDPDEDVRAAALQTLKDTAEEVPVDSLARMVREDPSPDRRMQALELLVERAEVQSRESLLIALSDPEISTRARMLIEDWNLVLDGSWYGAARAE